MQDKIIAAIRAADFNKAAIRAALVPFLGQPGQSGLWHFGKLPTDQLEVMTEGNRIIGIRYWSGLKWSTRNGYGQPSVEVFQEQECNV